jgi:DNA-binding CsgD family transcriptional regulator
MGADVQVEVPMDAGGMRAGAEPFRAEVVRSSERTRITRLFLAGGTVIRKEPLGPDTERRVRHEVPQELRALTLISLGLAELWSLRDHQADVPLGPGVALALELAQSRTPAAPVTAPAEQLPEPLSQAEARVLRLLPTSLSAPEIARELYVSVNTVRTHMRHLYDKLGAHRRLEAINRARALGLLTPVSHSA